MDDEVTLGFKPWFSFLLSENPWAYFQPYTLIAPAIKLRFDDDDDNMAHPED